MPSDAKALALLGAIFGALAVFPLMKIYEDLEALGTGERALDADAARLALADAARRLRARCTGSTRCRPLSDIPGLALTLAAQAALVTAFVRQRLNPARTPEALADSGKMIVLGAFLSALAIGMRSQAMWLTLPLLGVVLLQRAGRGAAGALLGSAMTFTIGVLIWAVPLVIASGGLTAYRAALAAQGGEDFSGVDMLYRNPTRATAGVRAARDVHLSVGITRARLDDLRACRGGNVALLRRAPRVALLLGVLVGAVPRRFICCSRKP